MLCIDVNVVNSIGLALLLFYDIDVNEYVFLRHNFSVSHFLFSSSALFFFFACSKPFTNLKSKQEETKRTAQSRGKVIKKSALFPKSIFH